MTPRYLICTRCYRRWNVSRLRDDPRPYLCPFCRTQKRAAPGELDRRRQEKRERDIMPIIIQKVRKVK